MPFRPCHHGCEGECIMRCGRGCAPSCHPAHAYIPPDPDSPVGRYLALLKKAEDRHREAIRDAGSD